MFIRINNNFFGEIEKEKIMSVKNQNTLYLLWKNIVNILSKKWKINQENRDAKNKFLTLETCCFFDYHCSPKTKQFNNKFTAIFLSDHVYACTF